MRPSDRLRTGWKSQELSTKLLALWAGQGSRVPLTSIFATSFSGYHTGKEMPIKIGPKQLVSGTQIELHYHRMDRSGGSYSGPKHGPEIFARQLCGWGGIVPISAGLPCFSA